MITLQLADVCIWWLHSLSLDYLNPQHNTANGLSVSSILMTICDSYPSYFLWPPILVPENRQAIGSNGLTVKLYTQDARPARKRKLIWSIPLTRYTMASSYTLARTCIARLIAITGTRARSDDRSEVKQTLKYPGHWLMRFSWFEC